MINKEGWSLITSKSRVISWEWLQGIRLRKNSFKTWVARKYVITTDVVQPEDQYRLYRSRYGTSPIS